MSSMPESVVTEAYCFEEFLEQGLEVTAGIKRQFEADLRQAPGLRLLNERFKVIPRSMGAPKSCLTVSTGKTSLFIAIEAVPLGAYSTFAFRAACAAISRAS
jgi:hypothetical protein